MSVKKDLSFLSKDGEKVMVFLGNKRLKVEVAKKAETRYEGLSNRERIRDNEGMLFIFNESGQYKFTMREMNFELDFIFLNDYKVVDFIKNIPSDYDGVVAGDSPYDMVIELPAGVVDKNDFERGDRMRLK